MTFIDVITAMFIFSLFMFGFSQAFLPLCNAWKDATEDYRTVQAINFIAKSFEQECAKPDLNIGNWEKAVSTVKELESYEITELRKGDVTWALKLTCIISGENLEVIGVCTP